MINMSIFFQKYLDRSLLQNENLGILDMQTALKVSNYDTNKQLKILTNDFDWDSKEFNLKNGLNSKFIGKIKM